MRWLRRHPFLSTVFGLIAVQAALLLFLVPVRSSKTANADSAAFTSSDPKREFSLGSFQVRNFQTPGEEILVQFSVCLTVEDALREQLSIAFQKHEQRVREAIGIVLRKADLATLSEPSLGILKRRLKVAIQAAMQTDETQFEVVLPDFTLTHR